ncbi:MAG: hypothetical protein IJZ55_04780 [Lachnospiraceae bacterium]|nr:hypothetical protein [Lachnospiraceae bacterium]
MSKKIKFGLGMICLLSMLCLKPVTAWAEEDATVATEEASPVEEEVKESVVDDGKDPFIVIERYELSRERIIPGNGFTLTLHLKNLSETRSASQVLVDITNPKGVAPVYGTVSQMFLGDFGPGESREVSFDYDSWTSITTETLDFGVVLVSDENSNGLVLRVPVGIDSIFHVMAANGPSTVYVGETASVSLNFRVLGEENISDVVLRMECEGETVATNSIGNLNAGTTKTQSISFKMSETGKYTVDFYMEYVGADGETESEYIATKVLEVKEIENATPGLNLPGDNTTTEPDDTKTMILALSGVLILAIFILSAVIIKKKR